MRKEYDYQKIEVANRAEGVLIEYISCDCGMLRNVFVGNEQNTNVKVVVNSISLHLVDVDRLQLTRQKN